MIREEVERILALALVTFALSPSTIVSQRRTPDLIIINAKIRTLISANSTVEALAITGNRISAIGTTRRISALAGSKTKVIDAEGRLVLPGFNDAHIHFMAVGNKFSSIDLRDAKSVDDVACRIVHYTRFLPKGRWILGGQWNNASWSPNDLPNRRALDPITPEHPVFIYHIDPKTAFANGLALKLAGIGAETKDPRGGEFLRDENREPTGILRGTAVELVRGVVPPDHTKNWPEIAETATNYVASYGITSVQDTQSDDHTAVYRELERHGKLRTRIYDCTSLNDPKDRPKFSPTDRRSEKMVRAGCVKGHSDGDHVDAARLLKDVVAADRAGYQVFVHAIGQRSNGIVLDVFEKVARMNGRRDRRFRMEHAHNPSEADLARFAQLRVIASLQPFLFYGGVQGADVFRTLIDSGAAIALGADAPITELNPLFGIHAAVNPVSGRPFSVYEAVRAYTIGSADAEFQDLQKGTIEVGKLADLVILSEDIFSIEPTRIPDVRAILTITDGRVVYNARHPLRLMD